MHSHITVRFMKIWLWHVGDLSAGPQQSSKILKKVRSLSDEFISYV
jgi:hypothetical protein